MNENSVINLDEVLDAMIQQKPIRNYEPVATAKPQLPVVILLDTSYSMNEEFNGVKNINRLNDSLQEFISNIVNEENEDYQRIKERGDFCVITYGNGGVKTILPWTHGSKLTHGCVPKLSADERTPMHQAIIEAGEALLDRYKGYYQNDTEAYRGTVFNLTDGYPTDDSLRDKAIAAVNFWETAGSKKTSKAAFYHMGVPGFDRQALETLSIQPTRVSVLTEKEMKTFFEYIMITWSFIAAGQNPSDEEIQLRLDEQI